MTLEALSRSTATAAPSTNGDLAAALLRIAGKKRGARAAVAAAQRRADARDAHPCGPGAVAVAEIALASDVLAGLALEHGWSRADLAVLIGEVAARTGLPDEAVAAHVHTQTARDPRLLELPAAVAVETHLRMLFALAPVEDVSLWTQTAGEGLRCVFRLGLGPPSRRVRSAARRVLAADSSEVDGGLVQAVAVDRWQQPCAALVVRSARDGRAHARSAAEETAAALAPVLEREDLLRRSSARERALVASGERLLVRFGFDLHDGPLQEVALLAGDLHRLRDGLTSEEVDVSESALAQLAELEERLTVLDASMREIVTSLDSPALATQPVGELLEREVRSFAIQSDIDASLTVTGAVDGLTASQRIALFRIVQESLANVREHSRATAVSVSVVARRGHVRAEISDNGRGFHVERTLIRAGRNGRMGLVGMSERARLLGGRFDVRSAPGGPTTVSIALPAWRAPAAAPGLAEALGAV